MGHLVLIGATGMLEGVALELARRAWTVTAVARRRAPLEALASKHPGRIIPLPADYTRPDFGAILARALREICDRPGSPPPTTCAAWIHSTAPAAPLNTARVLGELAGPSPVDFIHIVSRLRTRDPRDRATPIPFEHERDIRAIGNVTYRQAVLGWIVERAGPRWLTHDEIAGGVITAIDGTDAATDIGQTEPVESSPA